MDKNDFLDYKMEGTDLDIKLINTEISEIKKRLTFLEGENKACSNIKMHKEEIRILKKKLGKLPMTYKIINLMLPIFNHYDSIIEKYEQQKDE